MKTLTVPRAAITSLGGWSIWQRVCVRGQTVFGPLLLVSSGERCSAERRRVRVATYQIEANFCLGSNNEKGRKKHENLPFSPPHALVQSIPLGYHKLLQVGCNIPSQGSALSSVYLAAVHNTYRKVLRSPAGSKIQPCMGAIHRGLNLLFYE